MTHMCVLCVCIQGVNLPIVVTTALNQLPGPVPGRFNYSAGTVFSVTPSSYETIGNIKITINGTSFGTSGNVKVGGVDCPLAGNGWSHTSIECILPPGQGKNVSVVV